MRARARGMTLSMVGIGLFKTQGLDEYGTAAVGWLRGAGLKATEGPAEHRRGGIQTLNRTLRYAQVQHTHTHATHGSHIHIDKTTYQVRNRDATKNSQHAKFPYQLPKKRVLDAQN